MKLLIALLIIAAALNLPNSAAQAGQVKGYTVLLQNGKSLPCIGYGATEGAAKEAAKKGCKKPGKVLQTAVGCARLKISFNGGVMYGSPKSCKP